MIFTTFGMVLMAIWIRRALGLGNCIESERVFLLFWCFSPDLLAHAPTIGPDVGAMSLGLLACFACWTYTHAPSLEASVKAGLAFGLALLTKLTWLAEHSYMRELYDWDRLPYSSQGSLKLTAASSSGFEFRHDQANCIFFT